MSTPEEKMIHFQSSDGESFKVKEAICREFKAFDRVMEDILADTNIIPLYEVTGTILARVIEYLKFHVEAPVFTDEDRKVKDGDLFDFMTSSDKALKDFDSKFIDVDPDTVLGLMNAANFLYIKDLLELACKKVADMMKGKNPEQLGQMFNIENDYTPLELEALRRDNPWAFV